MNREQQQTNCYNSIQSERTEDFSLSDKIRPRYYKLQPNIKAFVMAGNNNKINLTKNIRCIVGKSDDFFQFRFLVCQLPREYWCWFQFIFAFHAFSFSLALWLGFCNNWIHSIFFHGACVVLFSPFFVRHLLDRGNRVTGNEERRNLKKNHRMNERERQSKSYIVKNTN